LQVSALWQFGWLWTLAGSLASVAGEQWQRLVLIPNGRMGTPCFAVYISHIVRQERAVMGALLGRDPKTKIVKS